MGGDDSPSLAELWASFKTDAARIAFGSMDQVAPMPVLGTVAIVLILMLAVLRLR
jgi:hypothetical protein